MLAEIFMIRLEMAAAHMTGEPKATDRHVPFDKATFGGFKAERVGTRAPEGTFRNRSRRERRPPSDKAPLNRLSSDMRSRTGAASYNVVRHRSISQPGAPYGNRTRVSALRGPRPRPLDEGSVPFEITAMHAACKRVCGPSEYEPALGGVMRG